LVTRAALEALAAPGASAAAGVPTQWAAAAALAAGRLDAPLLVRSITSSAAALADINVAVPSMGESITEGTVAVILKKPGDVVVEDDVIAQLETDKVTMDIKYQNKTPGIVKAIQAAEGDTVTVGQAFAVVEENADAAASAPAAKAEEPAAAPAAPAEAPKQAAAAAPPPP
jgi:2-oxoglutarate dehydrogenase E2 component (dihydrolipoamide succinyltransferase)